jgi:hypothetical protein
MSQMPPGGPPSYPPNYPPYVPPGMQGPGGYSMQPMGKTSAAAVTSLVCGLLLCIPLAVIVAIITGIIGIAATSNPMVRGRGMAIAGLILGIVGLGLWGIGGGTALVMFQHSKPQRVFARQYVSDLIAGNVDQCVQHSSGNLSKDQIALYSKQAQGWGTLNDMTVLGFMVENSNGTFSGAISGVCKFGGTPHTFALTLVRESGVLKVDTFRWQ